MRLEDPWNFCKRKKPAAKRTMNMLVKKFLETCTNITQCEINCGGRRSAVDSAFVGVELYKILQSRKLCQSCMSKECLEWRTFFLMTFGDSNLSVNEIILANCATYSTFL